MKIFKVFVNFDRIRILKMLVEGLMGFKEIKEILGVESLIVFYYFKFFVKIGMVKKGEKYEFLFNGCLFLCLFEIIMVFEEVEE